MQPIKTQKLLLISLVPTPKRGSMEFHLCSIIDNSKTTNTALCTHTKDGGANSRDLVPLRDAVSYSSMTTAGIFS